MVYLIIIITALYIALIVSFCLAYTNVKTFNNPITKPKTEFSVVIPFRNEAQYLPTLLKSILKLDYPLDLFEIILIDDASDDRSVSIIHQFITNLKATGKNISIQLIKNQRASNSPKKDAITLAITKAKYDWIITTDADCLLPKQWLTTFDAFIKIKHPKLIVAPLTYTDPCSTLDTFQLLDVLSLQTVTVSGFGLKKPFLCNGANLAYTKSVFNSVKGFKGNNNISSGDDVFLLEKVLATYKNEVHYLKSKDAIVRTYPEVNLKSLFLQRVRWAAKTSSYSNIYGKLVGFIVLLMNALLVLGCVLSSTHLMPFTYILMAFFLKSSVDFWCIYKSASFYQQTKWLNGFLLSSLLYPFISVFVAVYSIFFGYTWKHRTFRK